MPVTVTTPTEKWTGKVREVTLGATAANGGSRSRTVTVGGETALPFLHFEGAFPNPPVIAVEIHDGYPADWSSVLLKTWGDIARDPAAWAKKAEEIGADLLVLKLRGENQEGGRTTPGQVTRTIKAVLAATGLPLIILGPGQAELDNELLVAAAEAASGERVALGMCEDKNYRTIAAAALAHQQLVVASSPIDVNIAKQINILLKDMSIPLDRILMDPTTGALGYGLEYTYSVMERLRLAALQGDGMTQQPMFCLAGLESWRQKESKVGEGVPAEWGDLEKRAITWETLTATTLLHAGANIVSLRHPESVQRVRAAIKKLMDH
ncbi:MAG: acetyl-CoA decarbonylase/synthase complex subunit delta [Chloroflexota bacterium]